MGTFASAITVNRPKAKMILASGAEAAKTPWAPTQKKCE
jgi:hypothetical protein